MTTYRKAQCWIFAKANDASPLCLLLKTNEERGRFWQPVTGTVEETETFLEGACREAYEETGFDFKDPPSDTGFEFEFVSRFGTARERVFAFLMDQPAEPRLDPKEHEDFQWIAPEKAAQLLRFPSNLDGLRKALEFTFGPSI